MKNYQEYLDKLPKDEENNYKNAGSSNNITDRRTRNPHKKRYHSEDYGEKLKNEQMQIEKEQKEKREQERLERREKIIERMEKAKEDRQKELKASFHHPKFKVSEYSHEKLEKEFQENVVLPELNQK